MTNFLGLPTIQGFIYNIERRLRHQVWPGSANLTTAQTENIRLDIHNK